MMYMTAGGCIDIRKRTYTTEFGTVQIPQDVWIRGHSLFRRGLYEWPYEYMARWCDWRKCFTTSDNKSNEHP